MRAPWLCAVAACGAPPAAPRANPPATIHGTVSVAASIDPGLPRAGTLVMYWMTDAEAKLAASGSLDLTFLAHAFDHLTVIGPIELSAPGARADYSLAVEPGDIVVSAVLDSQHDAIGGMLGATGAPGVGDLMGDAKVVHVDTVAARDLVLDQAVTAPVPDETCTGPHHELVQLDAPEVAGAMGNATTRRLCVVLPASYGDHPERRYPVVYEFPGWGSDDRHLMKEFHHDQLFAAAAPEAILVIVDTSTRSGSSYLVDSPRTGSWDRYVTARVIPAIDARYRTIATRDGRATTGLSTGGFGALSLGLRHPDLFGVVTAAAPDGADITRWLFDYPRGTPPAWSLAMLRVEAATGGAGFFASYGNDWSPDDSPRGFALPIDLATGRPVEAVAERWRAQGPARWLDDPARRSALVAAFDGRLCLAVGKHDEFGLYQAMRDFAAVLTRAGLHHQLDLAEGGHIDPEVMTRVYRCAAAHLAR